jgi:hypothetical protein
VLAYVLLAVAQTVGLLLILFGAPGLWLQLVALGLFGWWTGFIEFGPIPVLIMVTLALCAELVKLLAIRKQIDKGVRRRVALAGLAGGGAGAAMGSPLPLLGSMFGAFIGAFTGSIIGIIGARPAGENRAALGGLVIATTMRTAAGIVIAVFTLLVLLR